MLEKVKKNRKKYTVCIATLCSVVFLILNVYASMLSTVALEQEARCGIAEHIHTDECFVNEILRCEQTAHVHDSNCYILLLEENDINGLLTEIDGSEDRTLEGVITDTVDNALFTYSLNEVITAETEETLEEETEEAVMEETVTEETEEAVTEETVTEETEEVVTEEIEEPVTEETEETVSTETEVVLDKETIAELNTIIAEDEETANLVLNENMNTLSDAETLSDEYGLDLNEGIALLSVGDEPETGNYNANFYVYVDDEWQCIGTLDFSVDRSGFSYAATVSTSNVLALINNTLGTNFARTSISLYYATSEGATNYTSANVGTTNVTLGTSSWQNNLRGARYVRVVASGQSANSTTLRFYTVRFIHADGSIETKYVRSGSTVELPQGYAWTDDAGNTYVGGDSVTITQKTDFTALVDDGTVTLYYEVNFPTVSGVTVDEEATVDGGETATETVEEGNGTTVKPVSNENVIGDTGSGHSGITRVIHFRGWLVEGTDIMLLPNTVLSWDTLQEYASGGRINLVAQWEYDSDTTCTFYIKYDSEATTEGQAVTHYTPCIFTSYVAGVDTSLSHDELTSQYGVNIEAVTDEEVYEVDKLVRAKYGSRQGEPYLTSFPDDSYIFEQLHQYVSELTVDGISVSGDDLNENGYAIRWYVFKCQSDSWHIDGKLVRKHGLMNVTKTFAGNKTAISQVKENFYIEAVGSEKGTERLTMNNYASYDSVTDTYTWEIEDVAYGELWTLSEMNYEADEYDVYSEYIITDASGGQSGTGTGNSLTVSGMTYAADLGETEVLQIDLYNVYRALDSLIIKKEDSETRRDLAGAQFMLYQNDELLKFAYDSEKDVYYQEPDGDISELSGGNNGYLEISVKDISYDSGDITIVESKVPEGYAGSSNVLIGYGDGGTVGILNDCAATFENNVLVIPNSSKTTTVTVKKTWLCPEYARADVEVQLFANGRAVNALFPTVTPTVTLSGANGYSYAWENLAAYANGERISWSVRETKIGEESCKSDYSFANWLVYYQNPQYTYNDDGYVTSVVIPVSNDVQRLVLRITKTNMDKTQTLGGATFVLTRVDENLDAASGFAPITLTTDSSGEIIYEDLAYGTYALTETAAPDGYELIAEPVYVTINGDNTISVSDNYYVEVDSTSSLSLTVKNSVTIPFPETGGVGTGVIYAVSLMLTAAAVYIYKRKTMIQK